MKVKLSRCLYTIP